MSGPTEGNNTFTFWIYLLGNFSKQEGSIHHHHHHPSPQMNEETLTLINSCKDKSLLLEIIEGM